VGSMGSPSSGEEEGAKPGKHRPSPPNCFTSLQLSKMLWSCISFAGQSSEKATTCGPTAAKRDGILSPARRCRAGAGQSSDVPPRSWRLPSAALSSAQQNTVSARRGCSGEGCQRSNAGRGGRLAVIFLHLK